VCIILTFNFPSLTIYSAFSVRHRQSRWRDLANRRGQRSTDSDKKDTKYEIRDTNDEKAAVELYRNARGYEDSNQFALAGQTYEKVIKEYPGTIKAGNAVLDIRKVEIEQKFDTKDVITAERLLVKFITDFNQNSYTSICLDHLAGTCYVKALELKKEDKSQQSMDFFAKAERIRQQIIDIHLSNTAGAGNFILP
jgi:tetratricopeptide (TPR) repeat protein